MKKSGVQHRITRVYLLQLLLISLATVLGVWATANIIEQVLVKQALIKEADHYWSLLDNNPRQPRPNTRHLLGLLSSDAVKDEIPAVLQAMPDGYHLSLLHISSCRRVDSCRFLCSASHYKKKYKK